LEAREHAGCLADDAPETLREFVIAVDPSGTSGDKDERSDEVGIVVGSWRMHCPPLAENLRERLIPAHLGVVIEDLDDVLDEIVR
jgi:hypothetical protein